MNEQERNKRLNELEEDKKLFLAEQEFRSLQNNQFRSRSINVGTAFGGVTEVSMRGDGGNHLWCILQPVEVTELIHQLAGNIGCHIHIQPRKDFASWRDWKVSDEEHLHLNGHAPFPNDLLPHMEKGAVLPKPEEQPGLNVINNEIKDEPLAIEKSIDRRKSKRTPRAT